MKCRNKFELVEKLGEYEALKSKRLKKIKIVPSSEQLTFNWQGCI